MLIIYMTGEITATRKVCWMEMNEGGRGIFGLFMGRYYSVIVSKMTKKEVYFPGQSEKIANTYLSEKKWGS